MFLCWVLRTEPTTDLALNNPTTPPRPTETDLNPHNNLSATCLKHSSDTTSIKSFQGINSSSPLNITPLSKTQSGSLLNQK